MKKFQIVLTLVFAIIFCDACINLEKLTEYQPTRVELNQVGISDNHGSVDMDVTYKVPAQYYSKHTGIEFRPFIRSAKGDTSIALSPVVFEGRVHNVFNQRMDKYEPEKADGIRRRVPYTKGETSEYRYTLHTNYEDWMDGGCLVVDVVANAYTDDLYLGSAPLYCDIYSIKSMVDRKPVPHYFYMTRRCEDENLCLTTDIPFKVNSSVIEEQFYEGAFVDNYKNIVFNSNVPSYTMEVVISDSPEAPWDYNVKLAQSRKEAVMRYFDSIGIPYDGDNCTFTIKTENWDVVKERLAGSSLAHAAEIINMIEEGESDSDALERKIRSKYPSEYQTIFKDYYPAARFAHINLCPVMENGNGLIYNYVCDLDECTTVHTLVEKPNDKVFDLNAEMLEAAEAGDFAKAAAIADEIPFKDANCYINANRALVYYNAGKLEQSKAVYENIEGKIPEADYNLGLLCLMNEEYAKADRLLNSYREYNTALTKLGNGNYAEAESILILLPESEYRNRALAIARKSQNNN